MKIYTPSYYARFRCLAGDCRDTCCRGWEIDIDPDSYARYLAQPGEIGDRLRAAIDAQETPHFRLVGAEERCPFLNAQNLCDLYAELGRESLCQICARHPRYIEQYGDFAEMGVGLACEAAARLVLRTRAPMRLSCADGPAPFADADAPDPAVCRALFSLRGRLFRLLQDRGIPVFSRLAQALALCRAVQTRLDRAVSIEEFTDILDEAAAEGDWCSMAAAAPEASGPAATQACTALPGEMSAVPAAEADTEPAEGPASAPATAPAFARDAKASFAAQTASPTSDAPKPAACTADILGTARALVAAFSPEESMEPEWYMLLDRIAADLAQTETLPAFAALFQADAGSPAAGNDFTALPLEATLSPAAQGRVSADAPAAMQIVPESAAASPAFPFSAPELPGADGLPPEIFFEQFAVYLVFRYFGKAAFDGEVLLPMQLCVASCALLRLLLADEARRTGALSPDRACRIAQLFSKEVEYCPDNRDAALSALCREEALSAAGLLRLSRFFARAGENSPIDERHGLC